MKGTLFAGGPGAAPAGAGAGASDHTPPSLVLPGQTRAAGWGGGGVGEGRTTKPKAPNCKGTQGKSRIKGLIRISFGVFPSGRPNSQTTQGPGKHSRVRLPNLPPPLFRRLGEQVFPDESLQNPPNLMVPPCNPWHQPNSAHPLRFPREEKKKEILLALSGAP